MSTNVYPHPAFAGWPICRLEASIPLEVLKNQERCGGGSSHQRTCSTGNCREIRRFRACDSQGRLDFRQKFNRLLIEFPSRLNRENLRAIREPEVGNSEPYPNNGGRCLAPHHLRPQVQILGRICSRTYQVGAEKNGLKIGRGPGYRLDLQLRLLITVAIA
jgi:hypothetical protein